MDFNFGNIFKSLDKDQKRIALSYLLSIPIAYIMCLRVIGTNFLEFDIYTRVAYSLTLSAVYMIANYFAIIMGQMLSQIFIPFRYMQLLLPQIFSLFTSFFLGRNDIVFMMAAYGVVMAMIIIVHIIARLTFADKYTYKQEKKTNRKQKKSSKRRK